MVPCHPGFRAVDGPDPESFKSLNSHQIINLHRAVERHPTTRVSGTLQVLPERSKQQNACFRRSRIDDGSLKIMENGWNMTRIALLRQKLDQCECQRGCDFNGHPPDPPKPHRKFTMSDFGPTGERQKKCIKMLYQTPDQPLGRPVC